MKNKLIDLLREYGLTEKQAERAAGTAIVALALNEPCWQLVYRTFLKRKGFDSANNQIAIAQAASEFMRIYTAETSHTETAAIAGLIMWVGDKPAAAKQWLVDHGYLTPAGYEVRA